MNNSKKLLGQSSLILVISTVLTKVISAVFKIPLASDMFLGDVGFGYYSLAHDLFNPFYILAISGLPVALSKLTAEFLAKKQYSQVKNNFNLAKKLFILLGVVFSFIVALLSLPIVLTTQAGENALFSILAVVPSVFLCFVISLYRGYFEGFCNMYPSAISKVIEAIIKLILGLVFSYFVIKATNNPALAAASAMTAVSIGTLFSTLYLHFKFKRNNPLVLNEIPTETEESLITLKTILLIAIPFVISSLASSIVSLIDVFTLNLKFGNASKDYLETLNMMYFNGKDLNLDITAYLYGIKSKAFTIYNLIPTITMSLGVASLPILTNSFVSKDYSSVKSNINYIIKLLACITLPAGLGLAVLAKPIMNMLFSSSDALSGNLLAFYGLASIFAGISIPLATVLQALSLQKQVLKHIVVSVILKLIFNILLLEIKTINIYAAPIATLICYLYITVIFFILLTKNEFRINYFKTIIKPFLSALACAASAYFISNINDGTVFTALSILAAMVVYVAFLCLFKTFSKEEIGALFSVKSKKVN